MHEVNNIEVELTMAEVTLIAKALYNLGHSKDYPRYDKTQELYNFFYELMGVDDEAII